MPPKRARKPAVKSVKKPSVDTSVTDADVVEIEAENGDMLDESVDSTEKPQAESPTVKGKQTKKPTAVVPPESEETVGSDVEDAGGIEEEDMQEDDTDHTDLEDELLGAVDVMDSETVEEPVPELEEVSDDEEINTDTGKNASNRSAERKLEAVVEITKEESTHDTEKNIFESMGVELSSTKKPTAPKKTRKTTKTRAKTKEKPEAMEEDKIDDKPDKEVEDGNQKEDDEDHETDKAKDTDANVEKAKDEDDAEKKDTSKHTARDMDSSRHMERELEMLELHDTEAEREEELKKRKVTFVVEPYPESFEKLRQLTVNIGPIKQCDLMSLELHTILSLNSVYAINFDLQDVEDGDAAEEKKALDIKEKLGFVRIPFVMRSPQFLLIVTNKLSKLNIDGRDMSVKFPQEFNDSLEEIKAYVDRADKGRQEKMQFFIDLRKRQLIMRNVPETINEETVKALFPESTYIQIKNSPTDGKPRSVVMDFETEEEATKCFETNKDIEIDDCKVTLLFPHKAKRAAFEMRKKNYNRPDWKWVGFGVTSRFGRGGLGFAARRGVGFGAQRGTGFGYRGVNRFGTRGLGTYRGRGRGAGVGSERGDGYTPGVAQAQFVADRFVRERKQEDKIMQLQRLVEQQTSNLAKAGMGGASYGAGGRDGSPHRDRRVSGSYYRSGERRSRDRSPYRKDYNGRRSPQARTGRGGYTQRESFRGGRDSAQGWDRSRRDSHPGGSYRDSDGGDRHRDRGRAGEDDQVAMMSYLKTTLAKMETKLVHRGRDGDDRHAPKRKADYDDYSRDSKKRYESSPGQRDYNRDRRTSFGDGQSRDQNWSRGSSFRGRGSFNARGRGHQTEGRGRRW